MIIETIEQYGYIILALYSFAGSSLTLIGASVLASIGKMDIFSVIVISMFFNFLGDSFLFYYLSFLQKYFKHPLNNFIKKYRRKIAQTKLLIKKHGNIGIFLQKYIYLVRFFYPIVLSLMKYDKKKFLILNIFASIVWSLSIGLTSFFFAEIIKKIIS